MLPEKEKPVTLEAADLVAEGDAVQTIPDVKIKMVGKTLTEVTYATWRFKTDKQTGKVPIDETMQNAKEFTITGLNYPAKTDTLLVTVWDKDGEGKTALSAETPVEVPVKAFKPDVTLTEAATIPNGNADDLIPNLKIQMKSDDLKKVTYATWRFINDKQTGKVTIDETMQNAKEFTIIDANYPSETDTLLVTVWDRPGAGNTARWVIIASATGE